MAEASSEEEGEDEEEQKQTTMNVLQLNGMLVDSIREPTGVLTLKEKIWYLITQFNSSATLVTKQGRTPIIAQEGSPNFSLVFS